MKPSRSATSRNRVSLIMLVSVWRQPCRTITIGTVVWPSYAVGTNTWYCLSRDPE